MTLIRHFRPYSDSRTTATRSVLLVRGELCSEFVWSPATCFPDACFCEAIRNAYVRQPANTWSSLGFVVVALWVAMRSARRARRGLPTLPRAQAWLLSASLVLVGLGSAFYHASLTFVGQVLDVSGMYLVATFILFHRLGPRFNLSPIRVTLGFTFINAALMAGQVTTPELRRPVFAILLTLALIVEWRSARAGRRWLGAGAAVMLVAFLFWGLDQQRLLCAPDSLLQGHALWHLLGAVAAACLYRSYEDDAGAPLESRSRA